MSADKTPEQAFAEALAAFQSELPRIVKGETANTGTYKYSYAALPDVLAATMPLLTKVGLSFYATPTVREDGAFVLRYALLHEAGHSVGGDYPLPSSATAQQIGSSITYGRRYCFTAVTGIAPDEDDDGAKASEAKTESLPRAPRRRGATERHNGDAQGTDDWSTAEPAPEPERVTDAAWIEDFRRRITLAASASELRGLQGEANGQWSKLALSREDAAALRVEVDERMRELTAVPA